MVNDNGCKELIAQIIEDDGHPKNAGWSVSFRKVSI